MTATLLALVVSCFAATPASADATPHTRSQSEALSALAARGVVLLVGAGHERGGSPVVRDLQRLLTKARYSPGPADGRYGPRTETAVSRYQASHGLRVDGIAGPDTLAALTAPGLVLLPGAGYERGGSPVVRDLQRLLTKARYSPGPADGRYGPRTETAVSRYQASHGLRVDGILGPRTLADLRSHVGRQHAAGTRPVGAAASAAGRPTGPAPGATARTATAPATPAPTSPARANARRGGQPAGGTPLTWIWLIGLLIAGLSVGVLLYARRSRSGSFVPQPDAGPGPPALPQDASSEQDTPDRQETKVGQQEGVRHQPRVATNGAGGNEFDVPAMVWRRSDEDHNGDEMVLDISRAPIDTSARFNLGVLPEGKEALAVAEAAYRRATAAAAAKLGVLLEEQGDRMGAEAAYRRADELEEQHGAFNLGVLLEENDDLAGAEAAYRRADQRGHAAAAANLGVLLEGQGDRMGAEAAYRRADERGEANGAFNLGVLLEENDDLAGAEAAYRRAEQYGDEKVGQLAHAAVLDLIPDLANSGPVRTGGARHGE